MVSAAATAGAELGGASPPGQYPSAPPPPAQASPPAAGGGPGDCSVLRAVIMLGGRMQGNAILLQLPWMTLSRHPLWWEGWRGDGD